MKHKFNGWKCCDKCRKEASKRIIASARNMGASSRVALAQDYTRVIVEKTLYLVFTHKCMVDGCSVKKIEKFNLSKNDPVPVNKYRCQKHSQFELLRLENYETLGKQQN